MVRPGGRPTALSWSFSVSSPEVSDTPEEPEDGAPGPGEGGGERPGRARRSPAGLDRPRRPAVAPPQRGGGLGPGGGVPSLFPPPRHHHYRSAVMVLVGVGRRHGCRGLGHRPALPASDHPLESATQDTAANSPLTTLAGAQNAVPAAAEAAGHSMVRAAGDDDPRHGPARRRGRRRGRAGRHHGRSPGRPAPPRHGRPRGQLEAASVVAMDKTSDVALVNVPEDLPVAPFADDTDLDSGDARPGPHLRGRRRPRHRAALHAGRGGHRRGGHRQRSRHHHAVDHLVARHAGRHRRRAAAQPRRVRARHPLRPRAGHRPPPPSSRATSSWAWPTTCGPRTGSSTAGSGCRAPMPPAAPAPRWPRCSPAGRPSGRLQVGQLIMAVNATPVRTMAEVRALLYVLPPGTAVSRLGGSSPPGPRSWTSPWAPPPSMQG